MSDQLTPEALAESAEITRLTQAIHSHLAHESDLIERLGRADVTIALLTTERDELQRRLDDMKRKLADVEQANRMAADLLKQRESELVEARKDTARGGVKQYV